MLRRDLDLRTRNYNLSGLRELVVKLEKSITDYLGIDDILDCSADIFSNGFFTRDFFLSQTVKTGNRIVELFEKHSEDKDIKVKYSNNLILSINYITNMIEFIKDLSEVRTVSKDLSGFKSVERVLIECIYRDALEAEYISRSALEPKDEKYDEEFYGMTEIEDEE